MDVHSHCDSSRDSPEPDRLAESSMEETRISSSSFRTYSGGIFGIDSILGGSELMAGEYVWAGRGTVTVEARNPHRFLRRVMGGCVDSSMESLEWLATVSS